ncbi:S8 family serine peptidase [Nocardioides limicola]|uniref:S8 family serine peptidase n=1 Tax=Nocardioides limicola TaxID=2803368 RepID=UPI00193BFAB3|nr:S8 family serine peptidase [Nocardioides sp. DJM-14]
MSLEESTEELPTGPTGRYIVTVAGHAGSAALQQVAEASGDSDCEVLDHLNMAIVEADEAHLALLRSAVEDPSSPVIAVEPEEYVTIMDHVDAAQRSTATVNPFVTIGDGDVEAAATYGDTSTASWGLYAVRAMPPVLHTAPWSGQGTTIAVLDTGIDLQHPDFQGGRIVDTRSFIPNQTVQDGHSHGTHCAGTAAGPRVPTQGRRYGVAHGAKLLIGKVLADSGGGTSGQVLAGINWAIDKKATVISMSLGSSVQPGQLPHTYYEEAALRALNNNVLIVAAAGNSGNGKPVGSPANAPSVLSVAALDQSLNVASFSCFGLNGAGGEVNVAAPGVQVYSAVPTNKGSYGFKTGTSMATPHAAGVAAMLAQKTGKRGLALWNELMLTTQSLSPLPPMAVGYGNVQVPVSRMVLQPIPIQPVPIRP